MDGGIQDNRNSANFNFEPKDKPWNWGGLIEPFWIGQNIFGAQSVRVNSKGQSTKIGHFLKLSNLNLLENAKNV